MEDTIKKGIIIGATGGIGRQLAKELAQRLEHLILVSRDADKLFQVQKELTRSKAQLSILTLDMLDQVALEAFVESLDAVSYTHLAPLLPVQQWKIQKDSNLTIFA